MVRRIDIESGARQPVKTAKTAAALLAAACILGAAHVALGQSEPARTPTESAVLDAIRKNPEIVREALIELQRRDEAKKADLQREAVAWAGDRLTDPATTHFAGNPDGDVTLVEFVDYNCGFCKRALGDVEALAKADPKLRIAIKELPVLGPDSVAASRISLAAREQIKGGAYHEFHAALLATRGKVDAAKAIEVAQKFGADPQKLASDAQSPRISAILDNTSRIAERLQINGTPAFVIGGEVVSGAVGVAPLAKRIQDTRKCGKSDCGA